MAMTTWQNQIDFDHCDSRPGSPHNSMSPGLTNTYDSELREKAGMHSPPPPPECMGLEGEYDDFGLVRRLAQKLDQETDLDPIDTLTLSQQGSTLTLIGEVKDDSTLKRIVEIARQVDGTRAVDVSQVSPAAMAT